MSCEIDDSPSSARKPYIPFAAPDEQNTAYEVLYVLNITNELLNYLHEIHEDRKVQR